MLNCGRLFINQDSTQFKIEHLAFNICPCRNLRRASTEESEARNCCPYQPINLSSYPLINCSYARSSSVVGRSRRRGTFLSRPAGKSPTGRSVGPSGWATARVIPGPSLRRWYHPAEAIHLSRHSGGQRETGIRGRDAHEPRYIDSPFNIQYLTVDRWISG